MIGNRDAWVISRLLCGLSAGGEAQTVSGRFRRIAVHLASLPVGQRHLAWEGYTAGVDGGKDIFKVVVDVDPEGPDPGADPEGRKHATLADVAGELKSSTWLWKGWLPNAIVGGIASDPGIGKTRFALDLSRRLYHGLPWPDGRENTLPEGSVTLWVQSDRAFRQMMEVAEGYGIPLDAIALVGDRDDPQGGLDFDDPEAMRRLAERIEEVKPAAVFVDTVGMTTGKNLSKPEDANAYYGPLLDVAVKTGAAIVCLTHLSKDGNALGRRIVEKTRVLLKMTQPDPEGQPDRRRLWVDKSFDEKPAPLGITMGSGGNEYDSYPPSEAEARKPGPAPKKKEGATEWLIDRLVKGPAALSALQAEADKKGVARATFFRARASAGIESFTGEDGETWWRLEGTGPEEERRAAA